MARWPHPLPLFGARCHFGQLCSKLMRKPTASPASHSLSRLCFSASSVAAGSAGLFSAQPHARSVACWGLAGGGRTRGQPCPPNIKGWPRPCSGAGVRRCALVALPARGPGQLPWRLCGCWPLCRVGASPGCYFPRVAPSAGGAAGLARPIWRVAPPASIFCSVLPWGTPALTVGLCAVLGAFVAVWLSPASLPSPPPPLGAPGKHRARWGLRPHRCAAAPRGASSRCIPSALPLIHCSGCGQGSSLARCALDRSRCVFCGAGA